MVAGHPLQPWLVCAFSPRVCYGFAHVHLRNMEHETSDLLTVRTTFDHGEVPVTSTLRKLNRFLKQLTVGICHAHVLKPSGAEVWIPVTV